MFFLVCSVFFIVPLEYGFHCLDYTARGSRENSRSQIDGDGGGVSVRDIRRMLSNELGSVAAKSTLAESLRAMRAACRKFLDSVQADKRIIRFAISPGHFASWEFNGAVGELRGIFGIHLMQIAAQYGLDIEDDLASILPTEDSSEA